MCCRLAGRALLALPLLAAESSAGITAPTLQEIQVAAHVIQFQETRPVGPLTLAVVYNMADRRSEEEANAIAALLGSGLVVGNLILRPLLVEQRHLTDSTAFGAVFATIGVDQGLLAEGLKRHHVLCPHHTSRPGRARRVHDRHPLVA